MGAETSSKPESRVADASPSNWVDRWAPVSWRPYLRLGRFDRPIGAWLLLFPCWWSQTLAQVASREPVPNFTYLLLFAIGALAMRAAGCAYNDYVDREIDARVQRTASRPIPSGQVTPAGAVKFIIVSALVGLAVLVQFNWFTIWLGIASLAMPSQIVNQLNWLGIASLAIVAVYPFAKRVTPYPQVVLGFAFSWGALVGWAAIEGSLGWPALVLFAGCLFWVIGYDTIYAHQDKEDDALLGLGSTALHFGDDTITFVGAVYGLACILWLAAGALAGAHLVYFLSVTLVFLQMSWQVATLDMGDANNCLWRFRSNRDVGLAIFFGLLADMALSWLAGLS